jgi:hypothetical protein
MYVGPYSCSTVRVYLGIIAVQKVYGMEGFTIPSAYVRGCYERPGFTPTHKKSRQDHCSVYFSLCSVVTQQAGRPNILDRIAAGIPGI